MKKKSREETIKEVNDLFEKAVKDKVKADDYVRKARNAAMKINLRLSSALKRKFCKHCNSYFHFGNYRVRTRDKKIIYYCFKCKKYSKYGLKKPE
jgi:RNase P subunit RPR2